ncbi:MAG: prolipoprotein diacylglyceryl transferase [Candidatus Omnitrophica bacterium]|nr:prolipoprotein diacylglyceryl transferase [Candidatus Omnitrophota bacterium]
MYPVIAEFGPVTIYSYGMMIAIAFLLGIFVARIEARRKKIKPDLIYDLGLYIVIGSIIGARLYYLAFSSPEIFIKTPLSIFKVWQGGLAIHGGIIGGIVTGIVFSKRHKVSFWVLADLIAPSILLGQAIGRIGCFLNGCCYGVPTESIFGVKFPEIGVTVHPTQLYELIFNLIGFFVLWNLRKKIKFQGGLFLAYLMIYNSIRVFISSLRWDSLYIWGTGLKIAQVLSGVIFIIALILFVKREKNA